MAGSRGERLRHRHAMAAATEPALVANARARAARAERDQEVSSRHQEASSCHQEPCPPASLQEEFSSSHGRRDAPTPSTALLMAQELLRYRPTEARQDVWLTRITELV
jgi:hypothetical protein